MYEPEAGTVKKSYLEGVTGYWTAECTTLWRTGLPTLSKTGRMQLMARMTGRPRYDPARRMILVTPGFVLERDRHPAAFRDLAEACGLRERFPNADVPEEVTGGFLIPPEFTDTLMNISCEGFEGPPVQVLSDADIARIQKRLNKPGTLNGFPITFVDRIQPIDNLFQDLSPREEALLREAPVFRPSPLEPQPDVVISPKENQC